MAQSAAQRPQTAEEMREALRPVVEAELWSLARDWRLRPIPVLNGTLWEAP